MSDPYLTESETLLRKTIRDFVDRELAPNASSYDLNEEFPSTIIKKLSELGFFGLTIDTNYGGTAGSTTQLAILTEELARGCASTAVIFASHLSLCTKYIDLFGSDGQKRSYLPGLINASTIGAFALSEPDAGSDAVAIKTTVSDIDNGFLINGTKHFITNGREAGIIIVIATRDTNLGSKGMESFIIEVPASGLTITPQKGKMGIRASSTCELHFNNVFVPFDNRIGTPGAGFEMTMRILDIGRILIAAQSVGIAQMALESSINYSKTRTAFGSAISDFQAIQTMLANMATEVEAARLLTYRSASLLDAQLPFETTASMAKLFASKVAVESADKALQIHGGAGYFAPNIAERLYRDAKVTQIYEGTSEIQRLIIARKLLED